jgi:hypothetical protein
MHGASHRVHVSLLPLDLETYSGVYNQGETAMFIFCACARTLNSNDFSLILFREFF